MEYEEIKWKDYPSGSTPLNAENMNHMDEGIKKASESITELEEELRNIVDVVYPVGAIYLSVSNVNPGSLFGGTWTRFAIGRTIIGINPDDEDFNDIEKTGGNKAKGIVEENLPAHKHKFTPEGEIEEKNLYGETRYEYVHHSHGISGGISFSKTSGDGAIKVENYATGQGQNIFFSEPQFGVKTESSTIETSHKHQVSLPLHGHGFTGKQKDTGYVGESKEMDILPPYITCYMWKRIK